MDPFLRHDRAVHTVLTVLLVVLAVGCAPKRVVRGQVQTDGSPPPESAAPEPEIAKTTPRPRPQEEPAPEQLPVAGLDLPEPEPRGPSGSTPVRRTAGEVQLGIQAASLAREQLGKPYQWGGTGPDRFDCSGLVWHVYDELGVDLPRVSRDQAQAGRGVGRRELQPGDLVFFATRGRDVDHVGIYVGDSRFVHAPRRYVPVKTDSLNNSWWRQRFKGARRVP